MLKYQREVTESFYFLGTGISGFNSRVLTTSKTVTSIESVAAFVSVSSVHTPYAGKVIPAVFFDFMNFLGGSGLPAGAYASNTGANSIGLMLGTISPDSATNVTVTVDYLTSEP